MIIFDDKFIKSFNTMMQMLENEQIRLRALEPEDLELLYKWENDTRMWEYGNTISPYSKFLLHKYLENSRIDLYEAKQMRLVIEEKESRKAIGTIDLYDFDPFHNRAGVGILIDYSFQQKSYGFQAIEILKKYVFGYLKIMQIYAYIPANNIPSLHLFRKCGFFESGLLKKWNNTPKGFDDVFIYQLFG
jgi:diamine N-acetyltransferase